MKHESNDQGAQRSREIAALISRYRASGLGLERFARKHGIPAGRLHYWLYQKYPSKGLRRSPAGSGVASAPVFQEMKIAACMPAAAAGWAAEMSLPEGLAIRFSASATPTWIGSVIQALQRPC